MHPAIVGQLGVERGAEELALADGDDLAVVATQFLNPLPQPGDDRRADEDAGHRLRQSFDGDPILE